MVTTYADLVEHALAYAGLDASRGNNARCRRAVQNAYKVLPTRHEWHYLWELGRVTTSAEYATGTVAYDHTGGASERQLTLSSGTWPAWAAYGYVVIDNIPYDVDARVSDTVVTLTSGSNPGADVASGTSYSLRRDAYPLPADFLAADEVVVNEIGTVLDYQHPRLWSSQRRVNTGPGQPQTFSLVGNTDSRGSLKIVFWPAPDAAYSVDFLYRRRPRSLVFDQVTAGSVTTTAESATVTGTDTAFSAAHVGSVLRLADSTADLPTGDGGDNPAVVERTITAVASATSVTVDSAIDTAYTAVRYVLSDPADVMDASMLDYLHREIEAQFRALARMEPTKEEPGLLQMSLARCLEADSVFRGRAASLRRQTRKSGFSHYPFDLGT